MPRVAEVPFTELEKLEKVPEISEEERYNMEQKMLALDKILLQQEKGKYKIELFFGSDRSSRRPIPGLLSFYESGSMLHGGGDAKIYLCPGRYLKKSNCEAVIPFAMNSHGLLVCGACRTAWTGEDVIGEIGGRHSLQDWAYLIHRYYNLLGMNCDISLKYAPDDIRHAAHLEQEKQLMGDKLQPARAKRIPHVYRARTIIKDVTAGADPLKRFLAFLRA